MGKVLVNVFFPPSFFDFFVGRLNSWFLRFFLSAFHVNRPVGFSSFVPVRFVGAFRQQLCSNLPLTLSFVDS